MKRLFTMVAILACVLTAACGAGGNDAPTPLGSAHLALVTSTPTHAYTLVGGLQIYKAGVLLDVINLDNGQPTVTIDDLEPGEYTFNLNWNNTLRRDASTVPATMTGPNPFTVVVVAGGTTNVALAFSVAGDPVPVVFEPGAVNVSWSVTEVPPPPAP